MSAQKIQDKVAKVGFDWPDLPPVIEKVQEELDEVNEAIEQKDDAAIAEEIGDLLFAAVNLARKTGNQAELLLDAANRKFVDRFRQVEEKLVEKGLSLDEATLEQMDEVWDEVKS